MRITRGLFRLWVVASVLWVLVVGVMTWQTWPVDDWVIVDERPSQTEHFDPDAYLRETKSKAFDPDAFLRETAPDAGAGTAASGGAVQDSRDKQPSWDEARPVGAVAGALLLGDGPVAAERGEALVKGAFCRYYATCGHAPLWDVFDLGGPGVSIAITPPVIVLLLWISLARVVRGFRS
jgi:hypothetical protein